MAHDPRTDLARITVPVLAVTGSKNLQVNPADLEVIRGLVRDSVETHVAPDVTHLLRGQPGTASLRSYKREIRAPIDAELTRRVTTWLRAHRGPRELLTSAGPDVRLGLGPSSAAYGGMAASQR